MQTLYGGSLMRMVTRIFPVVALALGLGAAELPAQEPGGGTFQWYIGGQGGVLNFRTSAQDRDNIPMAGGHLLVVAKRTGLLLSVEEGFGSNELGVFTDGVGTTHAVKFDDIRRYSGTLMAFPLRLPIQPYFGLGLGIQHVVNPVSDGLQQAAEEIGSSYFSVEFSSNWRASWASARRRSHLRQQSSSRRDSVPMREPADWWKAPPIACPPDCVSVSAMLGSAPAAADTDLIR